MSDYNVDTLENKIVVDAQEALKQLDQIIGSVDKAKSSIESMKNATGLKVVDKEAKQATSSLTKMQLITQSLRKALNLGALVYGAKKLFDYGKGALDNSVAYSETLNLFEVSMGRVLDQYGNLDEASSQYYMKALNFQNKLNEAFGTNMEETMRYQALYNQMAKSMGINNQASYTISENLTKLGIDLASLFNKDESATMEALRAGVLAGQTKPLRNYGLDVTQNSLAPLLGELGIDRAVSDLSQAEKMILRYIAVLKQASAAHGDFAKTIESPANQLKVMKQQLAELKTAFGNLFQGLVAQILPYVNAAIMVIKELIKAIGSLFGLKVSSHSNNLAQTIGVEELESGLGGAAGAAKELKAQIMGFDEINNISIETNSGGGGVGGDISPMGIDSRLLDAMKEYDNLMGNVKMKATEIRDNVMDWLGFMKKINPLTGEINWELKDGLTNFQKILDIVKAIGIAFAGWKISRTITKFMDNLGILKGTQAFRLAFGFTLGITGIYLAYKGTEHLLDGDVDAFTILETCLGIGAGTFGIVSMLKATKLGKTLSLGKQIKIGLGVMLVLQGLQVSADGVNKDDIKKKIGGVLESALGGFLIGNQVGGPVIGITVAVVVSMTNIAVQEWQKAINIVEEYYNAQWSGINGILDNNKALKEQIDIIKTQREEIQKNVDASLAQHTYNQTLVAELESLVDSNGKVYAGYESRVKFILEQLNEAYNTEYHLIGNQITRNGELVDSYDEIQQEIYKIIEAKKAQIILEANEEAYANALKNRIQLSKNVQQAEENMKKALVEMYEQGIDINGEQAQTVIKQLENTLNNAKNLYKENTKDIIYYEDLHAAIITGNSEKINEAVENMTSVYETEQGKVSASLAERINDAIMFAENTEAIFNDLGEEITAQSKARMESTKKILVDGLIEQTRNVTELTEEQTEAWRVLAQKSNQTYQEALSSLPEHAREMVESATGTIINKTNEAIPKVEQASRNIMDAITKNVDGSLSIDFGLNVNFTELKNKLISMRSTIDKMASVPLVGSVFTKYKSNLNTLINQLSGYASGGMPDMGEIFVAREAGPELVGQIGHRTAVANNSQIVEAVSRGVYEAVSAAMQSGSTTVKLDVRAEEGIIVKKASQGFTEYVMQTGELPFPVPV